MVFLLQATFGNVGEADDAARSLSLLVAHPFPVVGVDVSIDESAAGAAHGVVSEERGTAQVDAEDLRSLVRIPAGYDVASLQ